MKATDLQIGDYVLAKPSMMLIKVAAVHNKKVGYHAVTNRLNWVRMDLLEPIPLTREILEMNGFTENYSYDDLSYIQSCSAITGTHINGENGEMEEMYFKYVHEVQNALRICGLNELADNFKLEE